MGGDEGRNADAIGSEQGGEAGEGFIKMIGIAQGGFKESELLVGFAAGGGGQMQMGDGMRRAKGFEMSKEHAEQRFDLARGSGNSEVVLGTGAIGIAQLEVKRFGDAASQFEAGGELFEKSAQTEEKRLQCFDFIFETGGFFKGIGRNNSVERTGGPGRGTIEKFDCFGAEAFGDGVFAQGDECAQGADAPFLKNLEQGRGWVEGLNGDVGQERSGIGDHESGPSLAGGMGGEDGIGRDANLGLQMERGESANDLQGECFVGGIFEPLQIEGAKAGRGCFDGRRKREGALDESVAGGVFLFEGTVFDEDVAAARHRLSGGHADFHAGGLGGGGELDEDRLGLRGIHQADGLGVARELRARARSAFEAQHRLKGEIRNFNDGEQTVLSCLRWHAGMND